VLSATNGSETREVDVVSHQATLHTLVSFELFRRVKLDLDIPVTVAQRGQSPPVEVDAFHAPSGASWNDLRFGARVELVRQDGALPSAAVGLTAWAPTGDADEYTGSGVFRYEPSLIIGGAYPRFVWSAALGRRFQPAPLRREPLLGSEIVFGAGAALRVGPVQIGPELFGSTVADANHRAFAKATTSLELLVSGRFPVGPLTAGAAFGPGLTGGIGTPSFRGIATVGYAFPIKAAKGAGAAEAGAGGSGGGASGATPSFAAKGGASGQRAGESAAKASSKSAPTDADGDGVPDGEDACPLLLGDASTSAKKRGCPSDRDGDGIFDADDRCPDEPGLRAPRRAASAVLRIATATESPTPPTRAPPREARPRRIQRRTAAPPPRPCGWRGRRS
jgi:OmpA-OmpF porin, OOP family